MQLSELKKGIRLFGLSPGSFDTIISVDHLGPDTALVVCRNEVGNVFEVALTAEDAARLCTPEDSAPWAFTAPGDKFRLAFEALRIQMAHLFDPLMAVHASRIMPLPHQITAVYQEMLPRMPLRFLLADDPGAGKTIMAGLLIKEMIARGDLKHCLIVSPGSLVEQWQDELRDRFSLRFDIMTSEGIEAAATSWFNEHSLAICRLDKLSRSEELQDQLGQVDWDLIIVDEAHKMSATYFGNELKKTKRYRLGERLSASGRNFLLMTATPHNGKEVDFQLFMALLDGDRFEGKFRDGTHVVDPLDMMRRLVKEKLVKMDGTPLFPDRIATTLPYELSEDENELYAAVTKYVQDEFNRAEKIGEKRLNNVGFALTGLQRRLASSPEAIYRSLRRRRERLQRRLDEAQIMVSAPRRFDLANPLKMDLDFEDLDELTAEELEEAEEQVIDNASASETIEELRKEIASLHVLEKLAHKVRLSQRDRKWEELSKLLSNDEAMTDAEGRRRKLVIFTEHRDTLNYLTERIGNLRGHQAIVTIHGGIGREDRKKAQEAFKNLAEAEVLLATDAAGEGINLQRANLMVNYDLPWNPNRLEQRFGRIHRIGQTEVCHLWNLVAIKTREGAVYDRLLQKLEEERIALGGQVFDVLGQLFDKEPLWKILLRAVRENETEEARARLLKVVDDALSRDHVNTILKERALTDDVLDQSMVARVREEMDRAEARRLQPFYIESFFREAFAVLGGNMHERESRRFEITYVPQPIRMRERVLGTGAAITKKYERITFESDLVTVSGKPLATLVQPGTPLLDATLSVVLEHFRRHLNEGTILIDENSTDSTPRLLFALDHAITDGRTNRDGGKRVVSKQIHFIELRPDGSARDAGYAPYLDYRAATPEELVQLDGMRSQAWLKTDLEQAARAYALTHLVPSHYESVASRRRGMVEKTKREVERRLKQEISHWDGQAANLRLKEQAGQTPRVNAITAERRRDELTHRLNARMAELELELQLSKGVPNVLGGALIIPSALVGIPVSKSKRPPTVNTKEVEMIAMRAVEDAERALGNQPRDVSADHVGYDIESRTPDGYLRFIEVKGRIEAGQQVTVTRNEILTALNTPERFILAIVRVKDDQATEVRYVREPFQREPDFGANSVNYALDKLWERGHAPN